MTSAIPVAFKKSNNKVTSTPSVIPVAFDKSHGFKPPQNGNNGDLSGLVKLESDDECDYWDC
ncbi:21877_t:CDS:2 [Gigaspora margarita]|uniref:21877_t:CDS:1 n=1 Tax=Gigaspora margarita TaxID=4874 RepID=A0ABN7VLF9_GIGMA|nr:21877_t:CDS:2 [Gigaspora margarita]